jgi:hypothetical protein
MVGYPKPGTIADNGFLKLAGWAWGRGQDLRELHVFVDGQDAVFASFDHPLDSTAICSAGFDRVYCDPNAGFRGKVDIRDLAPGAHKLLVVATDLSDDPLPSEVEIEFTVPEVFVNHPPRALDDEAIITVREGIGPETVIDGLVNDFDVDGQQIELAADAIVTYPNQGTVSRRDDGHVSCRPFPWPSGSDVFSYRIVDALGASSVALVQIHFMEAVILP